jgi:ACR3 family arsenite efflux pump ArsB
MMVTLKVQQVFQGGDTKAQVLAQTVNFVVIPFLSWAIGQVFFAHRPFMALGLLLAGLLPTSGMTISWTGFAKGNVAAAVKMTVVGLVVRLMSRRFSSRYASLSSFPWLWGMRPSVCW